MKTTTRAGQNQTNTYSLISAAALDHSWEGKIEPNGVK